MSAADELAELDRREFEVCAELDANADQQDQLLGRSGQRKAMIGSLEHRLAVLISNLRNLYEAPAVNLQQYAQARREVAEARKDLRESRSELIVLGQALLQLEAREEALSAELEGIDRHRARFGDVVPFPSRRDR